MLMVCTYVYIELAVSLCIFHLVNIFFFCFFCSFFVIIFVLPSFVYFSFTKYTSKVTKIKKREKKKTIIINKTFSWHIKRILCKTFVLSDEGRHTVTILFSFKFKCASSCAPCLCAYKPI